jgi:hypothetical protein
MTPIDAPGAAPLDQHIKSMQWGPAVAGALLAAAIALVLHAFAAAIGLAVSSTSPTWRDSSIALHLLSGLYMVLSAIVSFGAGAYVAGRLATRPGDRTDEIEFRDGSLGLVVWALAILLTAFISFATAQALTRLAAPSGGSPGSAQSVAGENIVAFDLDRLLRTDRRPPNTDIGYARSEAARILLTSAGHAGMASEDRAYLTRLVSNTTGLAAPDAEKRVETVVTQVRDNIRKARRTGVLLAFMAGAAALLGAAVAWFAACAGGEHRDGKSVPINNWGWFGPRRAA